MVELKLRESAAAAVGCILVGVLACATEPPPAMLEPVAALPAEPVPTAAAVGPGAPVVVAPPPVVVAAAAPAHGGTVVMAGSYPVEVVPHASGEVYAYVLGDAPPPAGAELSVVVPVRRGVRTVALSWDEAAGRWSGRVRRAVVVPGPVDVTVVVGGARWVGHVATIVVLPAVVVVEPTPVVVVTHGKHRKHRKLRHGHHGGGDVRIRFH